TPGAKRQGVSGGALRPALVGAARGPRQRAALISYRKFSQMPVGVNGLRRAGKRVADWLGYPVLPETGDAIALEDERRDLTHMLARSSLQVVELRFPFCDSRISVEVEV